MMRMRDMGSFSHLFVCSFFFHVSELMVVPAITDVTVEALCPGQDECSPAVYLSGFQQAITGLGGLIVTPLVGNLSDRYGRKALLHLPMIAAIIPLGILAYSRTMEYVYAYYIVKTITAIFCDSSMLCLSVAYLADVVCESQRVSAFGILYGVASAGYVTGTLATRFLPAAFIFPVAASVSLLAAVYMMAFLKETGGGIVADEERTRPLCSPTSNYGDSPPKLALHRKVVSRRDMLRLLRSSLTLRRIAIVTLLIGLAENGLHTGFLYFLKAQFHFDKNQFADLLLFNGVVRASAQLLLTPVLAPRIDDEKLLNTGILAYCGYSLIYSIAWASWVPYCGAFFIILYVFIQPCLKSIVSKNVGSGEQGMAQGFITGITSFSSVLAPLIFTPLTALSLSDDAPFDFKGFGMMCAGFPFLLAFACSITMRKAPETAGVVEVEGVAQREG